jgi:hypothetical protein
VVDSAALVAVVPREPAVPVGAVPHPLREPVVPLLAQLLVVVGRVVEPVGPLELLRSRQSSSAALARSTT